MLYVTWDVCPRTVFERCLDAFISTSVAREKILNRSCQMANSPLDLRFNLKPSPVYMILSWYPIDFFFLVIALLFPFIRLSLLWMYLPSKDNCESNLLCLALNARSHPSAQHPLPSHEHALAFKEEVFLPKLRQDVGLSAFSVSCVTDRSV